MSETQGTSDQIKIQDCRYDSVLSELARVSCILKKTTKEERDCTEQQKKKADCMQNSRKSRGIG